MGILRNFIADLNPSEAVREDRKLLMGFRSGLAGKPRESCSRPSTGIIALVSDIPTAMAKPAAARRRMRKGQPHRKLPAANPTLFALHRGVAR